MRAFLRDGLGGYEDGHDDLPGDAHLPAQRLHPLGLRLAAGAGARGGRAARRRGLRAAALLARLPPPGAGRDPVPPPPRLPAAPRPLVALEAGPRGLAGGPHRLPAGRRGDAAAGRGGLHAQPGADDRRLLPLQGPLRRLARRRLALLGPADRRRDRQQRRQLAVGRGDRQRHPAQPRPQPGPPGERFDPDGALRAPLPARAGVGARQGDLRTLADGRLRPPRLPAAARRPRRGGGGVQGARAAHRIGRWDGWR